MSHKKHTIQIEQKILKISKIDYDILENKKKIALKHLSVDSANDLDIRADYNNFLDLLLSKYKIEIEILDNYNFI